MTKTTKRGPHPAKRIKIGCDILHERIAEAYEPDWQDLVERIYQAMREADAKN